MFVLEVNIMPTAIKGQHPSYFLKSAGRVFFSQVGAGVMVTPARLQKWGFVHEQLVVVKVGILFLINAQSSLQE